MSFSCKLLPMQLLLLLLGAASVCHSSALRRHEGDRVLAFVPTNEQQLQWLEQLHEQEGQSGKLGENIRFWSGPAPLHRQSVVYVPRSSYSSLMSAIPQSATQSWWTVQQENLGQLVEQERRQNLQQRAPHTRFLFLPCISAPCAQLSYTLQIIDFLKEQAAICGSFCQLETIGRSFENRELRIIKIGDNSPSKRIIWIDAGFHAREWIAPATALYFIDKIIAGYKSNDATITNLLKYFTIYIAPLVNPDGYEYTHTNNRYWRKTRSVQPLGCRGVDPNRNFGYMWGGKGTSGSACSDIYRGQSSFSEAETRAVRDRLLRDAGRTISYITIHSYGQMWMNPYGYDYNVDSPNSAQMMRAVRAASSKLYSLGTKYSIGNSATVIYPAAGSSDDWAHSIGIPYSHTIELPDTGRYGFNLPSHQIKPVGSETLQALQEYMKVVQSEN